MGMIPSNLDREINSRFAELRKDFARVITVFGAPEKYDCPNCIASIEDNSLNVYDSSFVTPVVIFGNTITPTPFTRGRCPICYGKGYLEHESSTGVKALVRWNPPDFQPHGSMINTSGGLEGKDVVRVKVDKCYYEVLRDCVHVYVSGVKCELLVPPVYRSGGVLDYSVTAYLVTDATGHSVRG